MLLKDLHDHKVLNLIDLHDHKGQIRSSKVLNLIDLPIELKYEIFHYLPSKELGNLVEVYERVTTFYILDYDLLKDVCLYNIKLFREVGTQFYDGIEEIVEKGCSVDVLQLVLYSGFAYDEETIFEKAAYGGNLDVLKWLYERKFPFNEQVFASCAEKGHLEIMKWLKDNEFPYDEDVFASAAFSGSKECLEWLFENGFPYDADTFKYAVLNGNRENMEWLLKREFPINVDDVFRYAIRNGDLDNFLWLYDMFREDWDYVDEILFHEAAVHGQWEILLWVYTNLFNESIEKIVCCPPDELIGSIGEAGQTDVLKWLFEEGLRDPTDGFSYAWATKGGIPVLEVMVQYVEDHGGYALTTATEDEDYETVKWLLDHGFQAYGKTKRKLIEIKFEF